MPRLESTKRAKLKSAKQHQPSQKSKSLTCCYLLPRFWVTPYLVPIGTVDLKKKMFPSTSYSFLFQIKAVARMFFSRRYITFVFSQKPSFFGLSMLDFGGVDIQSYRRWGWVFFHPQNKHLLRWKAKMEVQTHTQPHRSVWLEDFEQSRGSHVRKLKKIDGPAWVSVDAQQRQCYETMFVDCMLGVRKRVYVKGATSNIHIWILQSVIGIWST